LPTINQLIRKGRKPQSKKTKAPALRVTFNALRNRQARGKGSPLKVRRKAMTSALCLSSWSPGNFIPVPGTERAGFEMKVLSAS